MRLQCSTQSTKRLDRVGEKHHAEPRHDQIERRSFAQLTCIGGLHLDRGGIPRQVCDARADIRQQVDSLKGQSASTVTVDAVKQSLQAIGDDLKKIGDAQGDLSDERRSQVEAANKALAADLKEVGSTVLRSTSLQEAQTQLQDAVTQLRDTYGNTLAKVDCS